MNFTEQTKSELCAKKRANNLQLAAFSGFVRTAGSIISQHGNIGFSVNGQSECLEYFADVAARIYGATPVFTIGAKNKLSGFSVMDENGYKILEDLGICKMEDGKITLCFEPPKIVTKNDELKRAYTAGAFMGGGSVTLPDKGDKKSTTGYHCEIVFSMYVTALDLCDLLTQSGFFPKLISRKESWVVYFKSSEEIKDLLAFIGADKSVFELVDTMLVREMKNKTNRENNCFLYNTDKTVDASVKQRGAIDLIEQTVGLESLSEDLYLTAEARRKNPELSLNDLATVLGITKSCLNHRLRKINAIAEELK